MTEPKEKTCPGSYCKAGQEDEPHGCPYQYDINNDPDYICTCCAECQSGCADDV